MERNIFIKAAGTAGPKASWLALNPVAREGVYKEEVYSDSKRERGLKRQIARIKEKLTGKYSKGEMSLWFKFAL